PGIDIGAHAREQRTLGEIDEQIAIDVAEHEIVIKRVLEAEELGRESRYVAGPVHAGDRERGRELVVDAGIAGTEDVALRVVDLEKKADLVGPPRRKAPELAEELVIGVIDAHLGKTLRTVVALALLDIEADVVDALGDIEIEHFLRSCEAFLG